MTQLPRFGPSNANKVVLFADFYRSPHRTSVLPKYPLPFERLDVNTLHNVDDVEELIHLIAESDVEIIASSLWTEDVT